MQSQLLDDDDCACFLVEAIAKKSQNIKWETSVDKKKVSHRRIRRVSLDKFYELVTGQEDAFYQLCMELPRVIEKVVEDDKFDKVPHDSVVEELHRVAELFDGKTEDLSMTVAIYLLGFNSYNGFVNLTNKSENYEMDFLKRVYSYAKGVAKID